LISDVLNIFHKLGRGRAFAIQTLTDRFRFGLQMNSGKHKQSLREVEDHLTVLEALQCALSLITDEEELREIIAGTRSGP